MMPALTYGLDKLGFRMSNYLTLTSSMSAVARQLALDAPVSSSSLSSAPFTNPEAQLSANSGSLETLNQAVAEQTTGGIQCPSIS